MSGSPPPWLGTPDVRALADDEIDRLLARMRLPRPRRDRAGLMALQWRFLCAAPFHNIDLLAGRSPLTVDAILAAAVAGRGGPCHVQATAFLALLRGLGFRAWLAAGTIGAPGDHLVCVVEVEGRRYVCDVGNGHPYRWPFPLDGRVESAHLGWVFVATGDGRTVRLDRRLDDGSWRRVYTVDPAPRAFADFAGIIGAHHGEAGFGPFLTGLRAASIRDDVVVTLRDLRLRRDSAAGARERRVAGLAEAERVLDRVFGLRDEAVDAALARLSAGASRWATMAPRAPRVAVTVSATARPAALAALLGDLATEWARSTPATRAAGAPLVLVVENGRDPAARAAERAATAPGLDLRWVDDGIHGRSIAESRAAQTAALADLVAAGEPIDAVWMLDDDLRLAQLTVVDGVLVRREAVRYFDRIAEAWRDWPEVSLLVGRVCGDPPIRPDAVLATGLLDVVANIDRFAALDPEAPYPGAADAGVFALPDYYYDHSEAGDAHLHRPAHWLPRAPGRSVRTEARACVAALVGILAGKAPTRPLLDAAVTGPPVGSRLRGGHAVFLDVDAALRHRYPAARLADGTMTRRADMVGATRLDRTGGSWVAAMPWPVLHDRVAEALDPGLTSLRSEFFGVMLARAVMADGERVDRAALAARAAARRARIGARLALAGARADEAQAAIARARTGWMGRDPALAAALDALADAIGRCAALALDPAAVEAALDVPADLERVAALAEASR
ncbi:MAG: arylamine N-acetyltransferase [bacterium]